MSSTLSLSVIVPVCDGSATLAPALTAILATDLRRDDYELIVVDDASRDGSPDIAARYADTVIRLSSRRWGSAYARNRGAELASAQVLAFIDPDAMVGVETLPKMLAMLERNPNLDAVVACHDAVAAEGNLISQYRTALLHLGEQIDFGTSADVASPCAVIRRRAFFAAGMYDEWRFDSTHLEGVDLGKRLAASGSRIVLAREIHVTTLGRRSFMKFCAELWNRSEVLARSLGYRSTRNAVPSDMVFTLARSFTADAPLWGLGFWAAYIASPRLALGVTIAVLAIVAINLRAYLRFARTNGMLFAVFTAPLHLLMQGISGAAICAGWIMRDVIGDRTPDAATQAYAEVGVETWPPVPRVGH